MYFLGRYKAGVAVIFMIVMFVCVQAAAEQPEFASSLNPVGSGARATGMGGAFIAVVDDATAASWNPAGLINLEKPEVSIVYSQFERKQKYESEEHSEINSGHTMDVDGINYASAAYPFVLLDRNMIISLNYQRLFEMNKNYTFPFCMTTNDPGSTILDSCGGEDFDQEGYLYTLSPAAAVQVIPELYVGVTYNIWDDFLGSNGWEIKSTQTPRMLVETVVPLYGPYTMTLDIDSRSTTVREEKNSFNGENWNLGFLWALSDSITLGGVYKTSFDAALSIDRTVTIDHCDKTDTTSNLPGFVDIEGEWDCDPQDKTTTTEDFKLKMPASYGFGLSYRHSDNLTVAFDMYRTDWSRFVLRDSDGNEWNPLTTDDIAEGRLKDTTQLRLGTEYLYITGRNIIPFRFGLFYDPEPGTDHINEYYGGSVGTGFARGRIALDISYQYRTGETDPSDFTSAPDSTMDVEQHTVMASAILYLE